MRDRVALSDRGGFFAQESARNTRENPLTVHED